MTKRETRVINAFKNCVQSGEFTEDYAITLIEDSQRYGWLSEEAKEAFYDFLDELNRPELHVNQATVRSVTVIHEEDETESAEEGVAGEAADQESAS